MTTHFSIASISKHVHHYACVMWPILHYSWCTHKVR